MTAVGLQANERQAPANFIAESIGMKIIMAVTGLGMILFLIEHLVGNLLVFVGPDYYNGYAHFLQSLGPVKWGFRASLALFLLLHIWKGLSLWLSNRQARPVGYHRQKNEESTIASRTMIYTGLVIAAFAVYHLLHYTFRTLDPAYNELALTAHGHFDAYSMVVLGFSKPLISGWYVLAMFILATHLSHAFASTFQTFGLGGTTFRSRLEMLGNLFAVIMFLGFSSIPLAVLAGWISMPTGGH